MLNLGEKLQVFEGFGGVGALTLGLERIGVEHEIVGWSEVEPTTIEVYSAIHKIPTTKNYGDITKIDFSKLPYFNTYFHGSPCQSFSIAGARTGGDEFSGTKSSLMWYSVELIKERRPKLVIWENVSGVLHKRNIHNFEKYQERMAEMGYVSFYNVLNARDYGVPQSRPRMFCVSILEEYSFPYMFPVPMTLTKCVDDVREDDVPEIYFLPPSRLERLTVSGRLDSRWISIDKKVANCLLTNCESTLLRDNGRIRYLTPREAWRLMTFTDSEFDLAVERLTPIAKNVDVHLYRMAGNSIVVDVAKEVLRTLFID